MNNVINRIWNQGKMVKIENLDGMTFQSEQAGHTFKITGVDVNNNPIALSGTAAGVFLRPDETDQILSCSVSGGAVYATLPAACYDIPGRFGMTVFLTSEGKRTAIYSAVGTVSRTESGVVASGTTAHIIDLINSINEAVAAIPSDYSALMTELRTVEDKVFHVEGTPVYAESEGWKLEDTGLCTYNENYKLVKYAVSGGQSLRIISDYKFQFQNSDSVPSSGTSYRVGSTYGDGTFFLTVPVAATYLIVSTTSDSSAYHVSNYDSIVSVVYDLCKVFSEETNKNIHIVGFSNGTPQNASNDHYVMTDFIPVNQDDRVRLVIQGREPAEGNHYGYGVALYNASKVLNTYDEVASNKTNPEAIATGATVAYMRFCIGEYNSSGVYTTLRSSYFNNELAYVVRPDELLVQWVKEKTEILRSLFYSSDANFVFFSDIHGGTTNLRRIATMTNSIEELDAVINGGDTVQDYLGENDLSWYNNVVDTFNIDVLACIGNHDSITSQGTAAAKQDIYESFIAPMVSKVSDIVQPSGASTSYDCYYYKDYGNVRVIVLDAMYGQQAVAHYNSAEQTWFEGVLADAITNNKTVICVNHSPFSQPDATRDDDLNWNSWKTFFTADTLGMPDEVLGAVDTFINNGGKFACWLSGHKHFDNILFSISHPRQFMFNTATANRYNHNIDGENKNDLYSYMYDCMNVIGVDTTNGMVKFLRIGYNMDGSMRKRDFMSYDYVNNRIAALSTNN